MNFILFAIILTFGFSYLIQSQLGIDWKPKKEAIILKMKEILNYYEQFEDYEVALEKQRLIRAYIKGITEAQDENLDIHLLRASLKYFEKIFLEIHNQYIYNQIPYDKYQKVQMQLNQQSYLKFIYWPLGFVLGLFLINLIYYCVADHCLKIKTE